MAFLFGRRFIGVFVSMVFLAGCSGSQPPIGAGLAASQQGRSDFKKASSGNDVIYITVRGTSLLIYSYPDGHLVNRVDGLEAAGAMCGDSSGDVFIAEFGGIFKYVHGGTTPVAEIYDNYSVTACAVDPTSGNLAALTTDEGDAGSIQWRVAD